MLASRASMPFFAFFPGNGLAIDPKRVIGERGFDYANLFCNPELATVRAPGRLTRQLEVVAEAAGLERKRLLQWIVAYAGSSAAWFLEDGDAESAKAIWLSPSWPGWNWENRIAERDSGTRKVLMGF